MKNDSVVAIVGATGAVGAEFIATMDKRNFRVSRLKVLASARSVGKTVNFRGKKVVIEELNETSFEASISPCSPRVHFAEVRSHRREIGGGGGRQFLGLPHGPERAAGYPEINAHRIREHKGIIANLNCAVITALVPLWPIQKQNRIARDYRHLPGGKRRGRSCHGRTGAIHPPQAKTTFWPAASARISATPRVTRSRCSSRPISS